MIIKIGKVLKIRLWVLMVLITYLLIVLLAWFLKNDVLLLVVIITALLGVIVGLSWWAIKFKAATIKKVEFLSALFAIVFCGIIWRFLLKLPGGAAMTGITFSILSIFYLIFSFALFNGFGFRGIFKKSSYRKVDALKILTALVVGISITIILNGASLQLLFLPGGKNITLAGLYLLLLITIINYILHFKNKIDHFKIMFKRVMLYGGMGIILYLTPSYTILDLAGKPRWAELKKRELEDPFDLQIHEEMSLLRYQEESIGTVKYVILTQEEIDNFYQGDNFILGDMKLPRAYRLPINMKQFDLEIMGMGINDLSGLGNMMAIRSIKIINTSLTNLKGLENVTSVQSLHLSNNYLLGDCKIQFICDLITSSSESVFIEGNAGGCTNLEQVKSSCSFKGNG